MFYDGQDGAKMALKLDPHDLHYDPAGQGRNLPECQSRILEPLHHNVE